MIVTITDYATAVINITTAVNSTTIEFVFSKHLIIFMITIVASII